ncbi:class I SAM-dependent methyltransferase [Flavihumibacter fluvii]|uniref:class I SAM-dependent methyltransferase n=1 Tax=Flavihumibacter fluvii TaxID=2838157 RepID=UPI001BDF0998|nr:class I SAM-dependent methyltransferase [Flavihumibacter fluvii]ULQ53216.1 class I SAM-dependent methyltransferase [Flavihumibacter fluvii]
MSTKQVQGKLWSVAPQYWSKYFEPFFLPMYKKTLEQVALDENKLLLDAGCGSGLFSHMAISTGAQVIGVDASPGLLEVAKERNPQNNFMEEDLEALPFASGSFDVVTGFNSFQYAGSFTNALSEAKRVLKDGGRVVIGIWDVPENSDATNILKAISTLLPPPPAGTPGPFALSEDGKIEGICNSLGLKMIYKTKVACPFLYYAKEDAIKSFMGTGPAAAATNHVNEKIVQRTIANAMQPYHLTEEMYHLQNSFLVFIAEK